MPRISNIERCVGGFSVALLLKLLLPPEREGLAQKRPKLAFWVILGQALPAHLVPCWWVGWWLWRAGSILQDTYLLYTYMTHSQMLGKFEYTGGPIFKVVLEC